MPGFPVPHRGNPRGNRTDGADPGCRRFAWGGEKVMKALAYHGSGQPCREDVSPGRPPGAREVDAGVR